MEAKNWQLVAELTSSFTETDQECSEILEKVVGVYMKQLEGDKDEVEEVVICKDLSDTLTIVGQKSDEDSKEAALNLAAVCSMTPLTTQQTLEVPLDAVMAGAKAKIYRVVHDSAPGVGILKRCVAENKRLVAKRDASASLADAGAFFTHALETIDSMDVFSDLKKCSDKKTETKNFMIELASRAAAFDSVASDSALTGDALPTTKAFLAVIDRICAPMISALSATSLQTAGFFGKNVQLSLTHPLWKTLAGEEMDVFTHILAMLFPGSDPEHALGALLDRLVKLGIVPAEFAKRLDLGQHLLKYVP